jgi:methyl-accepting chemotaxis protein
MSKKMGFIKKLGQRKLTLVVLLPIVVLGVSLFGLFYLDKLATMQALERDHIELAWKNKYYINQYATTGSETAYEEFTKGQKEMQSKPENFIQMITLLDKMVLPTDMKIGIEMCYKDIQDEQTWVQTLEQYRLGKIDKATYFSTEDKIFEQVKKNSDDFHILFRKVQSKVQLIVLVLVVLTNLFTIFALYWIVWPMRKGIELLKKNVDNLADGNLSIIEEGQVNNEVGVLAQIFKEAIEKIRTLMNEIQRCMYEAEGSSLQFRHIAEENAAASQEVAATMQGITQATELQVQNVVKTKSTAEAMQARFKQVDKGLESILASANEMQTITEQGKIFFSQSMTKQMKNIHDEVGESVEKVQELGEKSKEIVKFVTVITGLAEQTNLLALNAAIESARAGEHGRGFAVVANEVKKLAEQSAQAAKEVSQLINVIQKDTEATVSTIQKNTLEVNRGSELAQEVGQGFEKLHESANHVVKRIEEVSGIYIELSHAVGDVIKGLNEVDQFASQIALGAEQVAASTEQQASSLSDMSQATEGLGTITNKLGQLLGQFKA